MRTDTQRQYGLAVFGIAITVALLASVAVRGEQPVEATLKMLAADHGMVTMLDLPDGAQHVVELAKASELTIYFQSTGADQVDEVGQAAAEAGLLARRNIYCFRGERFLACIDANDGALLWKNNDQNLLEAIGSNSRAQHYITGYATTCYMKCNEQYLFFAGPQRKQMVVASAGDVSWPGRILTATCSLCTVTTPSMPPARNLLAYDPPQIAQVRVYVGSADGRVVALAARTGRFLWSYRVAPEERLIPVYGKLISTWPVSGGIVVDEGSVYAAAGIAHYDATHVIRLDAVTGEPLATNRDSGALAPEVNGGVSVQGDLMIVDGELQFLGGGVCEVARYDLQTLRCLNEPKVQVTSQFRTAFYPYYLEYGKYLSLEHTCADGSTLCHDASYDGNLFTSLALEAALPPGETRPRTEASHWMARRGKGPEKLWQEQANRRFTSFIVSPDRLWATGHPENAPEQALLTAINMRDGSDAWTEELPALAVKGGTAIDADNHIYVATENGQLLCYTQSI